MIDKYPYISDNALNEQQYNNFCILFIVSLSLILAALIFSHLPGSPEENSGPQLTHLEPKSKIANSFFMHILEKTEHFSEVFYKDNEGIAIAYGWNISKNTYQFNEKLSSILNFSLKEKHLIGKYSQKNLNQVPSELQKITICKEDSFKIVNYMYYFYLDEFTDILLMKSKNIRIVENFNQKFSLEDKAVFSHMAYKVGKTNLMKYNKFYSQLIYMLNSNNFSKADYHNLAQEVSYTFKYKGKTLIDEKAQSIHRSHLLSNKSDNKSAKNLTI